MSGAEAMTLVGDAAQLEDVGCALCGGRDARQRYVLQRARILTCAACGMSYVSPRVPGPVMRARLQRWAVQDTVDAERLAIAFEPNTMRLYARYVRRLTALAGGPGRLLDVGCATGSFLEAARRQGWTVEGLELGQASAAYARDVLGLTVREASLYDAEPGDGRFDAIVFLEVIEHLEDPPAALARLYRWLRPGGLLLLSTPNFDSLYRRLHGAGWWVVNCEEEHIQLFTRSTLRRALRGAGFAVLSHGSRSIDYAGILSQARGARQGPAVAHGYYAARSRKLRLKALLRRAGLLAVSRAALALQDRLLSLPGSPLSGLGEQLVAIARRPG